MGNIYDINADKFNALVDRLSKGEQLNDTQQKQFFRYARDQNFVKSNAQIKWDDTRQNFMKGNYTIATSRGSGFPRGSFGQQQDGSFATSIKTNSGYVNITGFETGQQAEAVKTVTEQNNTSAQELAAVEAKAAQTGQTQTYTQNGKDYNVNPDGSFESVKSSYEVQQEAAKAYIDNINNKVSSGTALVVSDIIPKGEQVILDKTNRDSITNIIGLSAVTREAMGVSTSADRTVLNALGLNSNTNNPIITKQEVAPTNPFGLTAAAKQQIADNQSKLGVGTNVRSVPNGSGDILPGNNSGSNILSGTLTTQNAFKETPRSPYQKNVAAVNAAYSKYSAKFGDSNSLQSTLKYGSALFGLGIVKGALSTVGMFEQPVIKSVEIGKGIASNPLSTAREVFWDAPKRTPGAAIQSIKYMASATKEFIVSRPNQAQPGEGGEAFVNFVLLPVAGEAIASKAAPFLPKATIETFKIAQEGGTSAKVSTFGVEFRGRGQSLVSKTPDGLSVGTPDVSSYLKNLAEGTDIKPNSALETAAYKKSLLYVEGGSAETIARRAQAIDVAQNIIQKTQRTNSKFLDSFPKTTERLNEQGVKVLLDIAKEEDATVFGSFSRRAQIPQKVSDFVPRDIDIRLVDASPTNVERVVGTASERLNRAGIKARPSPDIPEAVEVFNNGKWIKAVEFKGKNMVPGETEVVPERVLGFQKEESTINVNGQKVTRLREELRGVTQGVIRVTKKEGVVDVFPPPKRAKDINSVVISAESLQQSKIIGKASLGRDIDLFKKLYGVTDDVAPTETLLADFSSSARSATASSVSRSAVRSSALSIASSIKVSSPSSSRSTSTSSVASVSGYSSPKLNSPTYSVASSSSTSSPIRSPSASVVTSPRISSPIGSPIASSPSPSIGSPSPSIPSPRTYSPSPSPSPTPRRYAPTLPSPSFDKPSQKKRKKKGFDVFVKREGKFKQVNIGALSGDNADRLGRMVAGNSAARSFTVRESSLAASDAQIPEFGNKNDFYRSRKNPSVFIEKQGRTIKSQGEKIDITYKGIAASKNKRKKTPFG